MQFTLHIPDDVAGSLRAAHGDDLGRAALERLALDGYQSGQLSAFQVQKLLGFDGRIETQAWLGRMGAHENYSVEDLEADRRTLGELFSG